MGSLPRFFLWTNHVGLYLILLTPLPVWPGFLFPHLTTKVLTFQVLVEVVTASAIAYLSWNSSTALITKRNIDSLKSSPLLVALALFLSYSILSAAFGVDLRLSLWGFMERQDGLVLWLHFFAWFAVVGWAFRRTSPIVQRPLRATLRKEEARLPAQKKEEIHSYWNFSYWVSVAVALTALTEWGCARLIGSVPELIRSVEPARISGVFGLPTALGPYLLFHFFYGFYRLTGLRWDLEKKPSKPVRKGASSKTSSPETGVTSLMVLLFSGELIIVAAIILGQTRGVILGLVVAVLIADVSLVLRKSSPRRLRLAGAAGLSLLVVLGLLVWRFRDSRTVKEISLLDRLTHMSVSESDSAFMRSLTWKSAARGFWDHPLMGWGHDNVYYALNEYYDPRHVRVQMDFIESKATWYDKSHNAYLDLLVEEGLLGGILFSAVIAFVIKTLWQMEDRRLALCLACGFIAHAISNSVAFDSFGSLFGLFLYLAGMSCVALGRNRGEQKMEESRHIVGGGAGQHPGGRPGRFARMVLVATALILGLALYGNLGIGMANAGYLEAQRNFAQNPAQGISLYDRAFASFSPYAAKEKLNCAYLIVNGLITKRSLPDASANTESALHWAREAISCHPQDAAFHMILNDLYNGLALYVDMKYVADAEASGIRALQLSPKRQEAMLYLGRTYLIKGEARRAVELNRSMVEEFPGFPLAHWLLGLSLLADSRMDLAKVEIRKAIELGYKFQNSGEAETVKQLFGEAGFNELIRGK